MTLLFIDSFDHYDTAHLADKYLATGGNIAITTGTGRRGTGSYRVTDSFAIDEIVAPISVTRTTFIVGFALKVTNWSGHAVTSNSRYAIFPRFYSASDTELHVLINDNKFFEVRRGVSPGTIIATGTKFIQLNKWYYIEVKYFANDTTGTVEVKINGVTDINFGPGDTVQTSDQINKVTISNSGGWSEEYYLDDLYICDDQGSVNNDFLGDVRVDAVLPDGAGASSDFTPSAGSNYQCVDDNPPNDDTDYVSENTVTDHDTYSMANTPVTSGSILGVQQLLLARKDDAGARSIRGMIRSGGTDYPGDTHVLLDSYMYFQEILEQDPDTAAAWTISGFNSVEFGQRLEV